MKAKNCGGKCDECLRYYLWTLEAIWVPPSVEHFFFLLGFALSIVVVLKLKTNQQNQRDQPLTLSIACASRPSSRRPPESLPASCSLVTSRAIVCASKPSWSSSRSS